VHGVLTCVAVPEMQRGPGAFRDLMTGLVLPTRVLSFFIALRRRPDSLPATSVNPQLLSRLPQKLIPISSRSAALHHNLPTSLCSIICDFYILIFYILNSRFATATFGKISAAGVMVQSRDSIT
jgi:hypothetical protein